MACSCLFCNFFLCENVCKNSVAMTVANSKVSAGQNNIYKLGLMSDICVCIKNPSEVLQNCMLKYCLLFHFQLYVTNVDLHFLSFSVSKKKTTKFTIFFRLVWNYVPFYLNTFSANRKKTSKLNAIILNSFKM